MSYPELRLSILEVGPGGLSRRLRLPPAKAGEGGYLAEFAPCPQPRCACASVWVHCEPITPDGAPVTLGPALEFWLDAEERTAAVSPEREWQAESLRLGRAVQAAMRDSDWEELWRWHRDAKQEVIRTTPVSQVNIENLPSAAGGLMIGYAEVFPFAMALEFDYQASPWAVEDQYCVQSGCTCKTAMLTFLDLERARRSKVVRGSDSLTLRYDYGTAHAEVEHRGAASTTPAEALLDRFKGAHRNLDSLLAQRHHTLQALYARAEQAQKQAPPGSARPKPGNPATLVASTPKVGRNDPCPCGSGKKYKRCCLGKK